MENDQVYTQCTKRKRVDIRLPPKLLKLAKQDYEFSTFTGLVEYLLMQRYKDSYKQKITHEYELTDVEDVLFDPPIKKVEEIIG